MRRLQIASLFLIVGMCSASMGSGFTCKEAERQALLKLKHSFKDAFGPRDLLGSWAGDDCCSWNGVGCDNVTGNVVKLDLKGDGIGCYSCIVAGEVSPALLELKYLKYLDLSSIDFSGARIPQFFGSMRQLQYLYLSHTNFGGKIPHNLGNLTNLVVLDLRFPWSGELETNSLEWAFKLRNLEYLDLRQINLSQALDSLNIIHMLPSLSVLSLAYCQLGNSHIIKNSSVSSSPLQHLDLGYNLFSGPVPHFIQNLSSIKYLDLSYNTFDSPIPSWLGNKIDLEYLILSNISFNGPFPHFIQNLSFLSFLDLSYNKFTSSIPSWLANKRSLEYLDLSNNQFSSVDGGIMNTIGRLCSLQWLDLSHNQLQEEVLEPHVNFSRCSRYDLEYLHMQNNNMSGQLPTFESLLSLQDLDLSHNNFETIPASFGQLSSLWGVDLSYNNLSVIRQVNLANLSNLGDLDISSNPLTLELSPDWLPTFQLEGLHIQDCKLNSPFPKWLLLQKHILMLDMSNTGVAGPLPDNIGNTMPALQVLRLANNDINGSIPRSMCGLVGLGVIDLQNNSLSGIIPDCWVNPQLVVVDLSSNRLSGLIPNSLAKSDTLQLLSLNNNFLEGELPLHLSNSTQLTIFDVGRNNLHGEIPPWNGANFPFLQILILRGNKFRGRIPLQLCSFHALQIVDLASNNLTGTIPECFGNFQRMGSVKQYSSIFIAPSPSPASSVISDVAAEPSMDSDEWRASEVIKGDDLEYTTNLHLLVNIDLSCNNLVGVIPTEITSLSRLNGLNLSHNHLKGTIPEQIGKMNLLESLDFSSNNLSGAVPESISSLDYLSKLNLSFNNLHGQIPTGRHFQTLDDPSIYKGNPGLCGDPLPKCSGGALPPTSTALEDEEEDDKHEKLWFYLVIMLGFASGFWGVIGILVVNKKWRHAYFGIAEELVDWIYVKVAVRIARGNR